MGGINADSQTEADQAPVAEPASGQSSESNLVNIFLQELGRLKRIVAGMGLGGSDGEDILQDVSIQTLKQAEKYRNADEAVRWLIKVTVNQCLKEHRRRRRFSRAACEILKRQPETKTHAAGTDEKVIEAEELEMVRESLQGLDASLLTPVVLRYFCELNSKEIGEILSLSPSTVRSRLREGRMVLAKKLLQRGIE